MQKDRGNMKPCFCIGCGSSIKDIDLNTLDNHYTIGTNHILTRYPAVKAEVFLDRAFWNMAEEQIKAYTGEIYCHTRAVPEDYTQPNMTKIQTKINHPVFDNPYVLMGGLSGFTALNLAIVKGYNPIYLLGYDMYPGHYYNDDREDAYRKCEILIDRYRQYSELPVDIINCNPDSAIRCFPFRTLDMITL